MKKRRPKYIDCSKNKHYQCMLEDAKVLHNWIEQRGRFVKETDYIIPPFQSPLSCMEEMVKSIQNHIKYFYDRDLMW